jgi:hypothetical protein
VIRGAREVMRIAGAYLRRYAQESSWREDNRRVASLAMKRGKSVGFTGYRQRHATDEPSQRNGPGAGSIRAAAVFKRYRAAAPFHLN